MRGGSASRAGSGLLGACLIALCQPCHLPSSLPGLSGEDLGLIQPDSPPSASVRFLLHFKFKSSVPFHRTADTLDRGDRCDVGERIEKSTQVCGMTEVFADSPPRQGGGRAQVYERPSRPICMVHVTHLCTLFVIVTPAQGSVTLRRRRETIQ